MGKQSSDIGCVDHVDTSNFPDALAAIEKMAGIMRDLVSDMDDYKAAILENWVGEGRDQFEKSYRVMRRELSDGTEMTWDMYEKLISAQETLIQNDVDVANGIKSYN